MDFQSPLSVIAQDIYNNYYSKPYPNGMRRTEHGMSHVVRAMIFGTIAYKLMCMGGRVVFKSSDLKLIQIALLLHDSGRQGEGEDLWDKDSAKNIYKYLTETLKVSSEDALDAAESMLNKDWNEEGAKGYQKLNHSNATNVEVSRNRFLRLAIQFGDCVDIYRIVEKKFNWACIRLYQFEKNHSSLRTAIERLLPQSFEFISSETTLEKNERNIFEQLFSLLERYPVVSKMFHADLSTDSLDMLINTGDDIKDAFYGMRLLFRGVTNVSALYERQEYRPYKTYSNSHSYGEQEIRKLMRKPHIGTWARTASKRLGKTGNPSRSVSLLGVGGTAFTTVGGGVLLDHVDVVLVSNKNLGTGFGPKTHLRHHPRKKTFSDEIFAIQEHIRSGQAGEQHNEIVVDITKWDCILYSIDSDIPDEPRLSMRLLRAIYLRDVYQNHTIGCPPGIDLPIYKFSTTTGMFEKVEVTDSLIAEAFEDDLLNYLQQRVFAKTEGLQNGKMNHSIRGYVQEYIASPEVRLLLTYASAKPKKSMQDKILQVIAKVAEGRFEFQNAYVFPKVLDENKLASYFSVIQQLAEHGLESFGASNVVHTLLKQISKGEVSNDLRANIDLLVKISKTSKGYYHDLIKRLVKQWLDISFAKNADLLRPEILDAAFALVVGVGACTQENFFECVKLHYAHSLLSYIERSLRAGKVLLEVFVNVTPRCFIESIAFTPRASVICGDHYTLAYHKMLLTHLESERLVLLDRKLGLLFFSMENKNDYSHFAQTLSSSQKIKLIYDYLIRSGRLGKPTASEDQRQLLSMLQQQALALSAQEGDLSFFKRDDSVNFQNLKHLFNHDAELEPSESYRRSAKKITPLAHHAMILSRSSSQCALRESLAGLERLRVKPFSENQFKRRFKNI